MELSLRLLFATSQNERVLALIALILYASARAGSKCVDERPAARRPTIAPPAWDFHAHACAALYPRPCPRTAHHNRQVQTGSRRSRYRGIRRPFVAWDRGLALLLVAVVSRDRRWSGRPPFQRRPASKTGFDAPGKPMENRVTALPITCARSA